MKKGQLLPAVQHYRRMYKANGHISGLSADGPYHLMEWHDHRKIIAEFWEYAGDEQYRLVEKSVAPADGWGHILQRKRHS